MRPRERPGGLHASNSEPIIADVVVQVNGDAVAVGSLP